MKKGEKNSKVFLKNYCIQEKDIIYYKGLLKAMKWEVTALTENSHGELSSLDGGEGIRRLFALCSF